MKNFLTLNIIFYLYKSKIDIKTTNLRIIHTCMYVQRVHTWACNFQTNVSRTRMSSRLKHLQTADDYLSWMTKTRRFAKSTLPGYIVGENLPVLSHRNLLRRTWRLLVVPTVSSHVIESTAMTISLGLCGTWVIKRDLLLKSLSCPGRGCSLLSSPSRP